MQYEQASYNNMKYVEATMKPITAKEMREVIASLKSFKTVGPFKLKYEFIKG